MRILQVCRNIPIKDLDGNPILLELFEKLRNHHVESDILFPSEYVPNLPILPQRYKIFSHLTGRSVTSNNFPVLFFKFVRLPLIYSFSLLPLFNRLFDLSKLNNNYDVIHAHYILPDGAVAEYLSRKLKKPFVITVRQGDVDRILKLGKNSYYRKYYLNILRKADSVLTVAPKLSDFLLKEFNIQSEIIPHGIDKNLLKREFKPRENDFLKVVIVAQMIERKKVEDVIDIIIKLNDDGYYIKLDIVGDGPLLNYYLNKFKDYNYLNFCGKVKRELVINLMQKSDVFTLISENETFGMVYLEAAASGTAIIGRKNTGMDGIFIHNSSALFVSDKTELYSCLRELFCDENKRCMLINTALKKIESDLIWPKVIEKYIKVYTDVRN